MTAVKVVAAAGLVVCSAVAGCTSSSTGPDPSGSASNSASAPSTSSVPTGTAVAPGALATRLQKALVDAKSVHLALSTAVTGSSTIKGSGDVALSDGTISRADINEALPGGLGNVRLVLVDGKTYAKLPAGLGSKTEPWTLLSASSSQPLVAQLATTVDSVLSVASPATVVTLVRAASSVRDLGSTTVDGATARQYRVVVDSSKLPSGLTTGSATSVPIDVYTDGDGRPVQLRGSLELSGAQVTPTVTLSDYGKAVSISAPPASQVAG